MTKLLKQHVFLGFPTTSVIDYSLIANPEFIPEKAVSRDERNDAT